MGGRLRTGFTTGTCAAAGSRAALLSVMRQERIEAVTVSLPKGSMEIRIERCEFADSAAECSVIKDGGDDPDVTHGAEIVSSLALTGEPGRIEIGGGAGVGTVTKPGLGLEIGAAAINPVPRSMITQNIREIGRDVLRKSGVRTVISVPSGAELAPKTDNPRLGIVGGISILGTSGVVVPFSTAAFAASIRQNLDVSIAMGNRDVVLTTGGRSEAFARGMIDLPEHCFVQMGDFSGYAIRQCGKKGVQKATIVGFIGKLAKMAAGVKQTHVKGSKVDMGFLAGLAEESGASEDTIRQIKRANTARHVLEIVKESGENGFYCMVCSRVHGQMTEHSEEALDIEVVLFDFDGAVLARHPE